MTGQKKIIIAGPNGAGKTTFAREFLPNEAGCLVFVNADLIRCRSGFATPTETFEDFSYYKT
jgi:predicted ABC-type ATPase